MTTRPEFVRTDIINKLKALHSDLETTSPEDARLVIEEAIETLRILRELIGIRDDILLEDTPPEGDA
jgi:predicted unusual protein kinase regulating ubiquinone biosynthesis (AarF/ABC1/UbiB family)